MTQPLSREQVEKLADCFPADILNRDKNQLLAHDAALRAQLETSMRTRETLAKNVNDGLLEIRTLRAKVKELEQKLIDQKAKAAGRRENCIEYYDERIATLQQQLEAVERENVLLKDEDRAHEYIQQLEQQVHDQRATIEQLQEKIKAYE